ncbi:inner membrane-spanning protein YciB [Phenylobacterium sp. J367]|uniref:inner membrane-spanning protein YciB n=1 Tax=Phenylobacterium sp. J367 TaxID=2898435 RepID=UPI0021516F07|nr:inner membrane-spanning protein YciB [Phenylobacterium sp. J367]MCR5878220.1 septation protein IspZ [Phenylobacterium sp. J367]
MSAESRRKWVRWFVDYSAPIAFAVVYFGFGRDFMKATAAIVITSVVALAVGAIVERRLAPLPLFVGLMGAIFGGLTLLFDDPRIMKVKPTVLNFALGAVLMGGLLLRKNPLKAILGQTIALPDEVWRKLMFRFGLFYWALAALNEVVWRTQAESTWVAFRSFGLTGLTVAFALTQTPLLMRYMKVEDLPPPPSE